MKKFIAIVGIICLLFGGVAHASNIGLEPLWNNVYDSTNQAIKAVVTGNQTLTNITADTATIRVLTVSGDTVLTNTTCDNLTADALYVNENIDWLGGNVTYLQLSDDIEAAIAAATAGDTIVLAAGTYTVTDDIDIAQSINVVGQGVGHTTIACTTDSKNVFHIVADNVSIGDLSISITASATFGVQVDGSAGAVFSNVNLRDMEVIANSNAGTQEVINYTDAGGEIRNVVASTTSADTTAYGIRLQNNSSAEATTTLKCYNVDSTVVAGATAAVSFYAFDNTASQDCYLYLYDCVGTDTGGTGYGFLANGADAYIYSYNSIANSSGTDASLLNAGVVTLYDTTLINGTTSGTIVVDGYSTIKSEATATVGGVVGRIAIISSDGNICYILINAAS